MATCNRHFYDEYRKLLVSLKSTVEGLLASQPANVWNIYGGLTRMANDVHQILTHKIRNNEDSGDYWHFFLGLRVLQPTLAPTLERHRITTGTKAIGREWMIHSLENHMLSNQLKILLQDKNLVESCYLEGAFLRQESYRSAFLLCLDAVERNKLALLVELNPALLMGKSDSSRWPCHVRSSSLPVNQLDKSIQCTCGFIYPTHSSKSCPDQSLPHVCPCLVNCEVTPLNKLTRSWSHHGVPPYVIGYGGNRNERSLSKNSLTRSSSTGLSNFSINHHADQNIDVFNDCPNVNYNLTSSQSILDSCEENTSEPNQSTISQLPSLENESIDSVKEVKVSPDNSLPVANVKLSEGSCDCEEENSSRLFVPATDSIQEKQISEQISRLSQKQRSESDSSYRKLVKHVPMKCLQMWWREIRRTTSEPELNSIVLLNYRKMNDDDKKCTDLPTMATFSGPSVTPPDHSFTRNLLKIEYPNKEITGSQTEKKNKQLRRRPRVSATSKYKFCEKLNEDNVSTHTLCAGNADGVSHNSTNHRQNLQQNNFFENLTESGKMYVKSGKSSKPPARVMTHQRSCSDVTPIHQKECHYLHHPPLTPFVQSGYDQSFKRRKSLLEDGGSSIVPMTECFFPRPTQGQSLTSFLSSQDFHSCAELDRENNHFSISEALIAVIEQIKWRETMRKMNVTAEDDDESDEEIQHLKQRIQMRRHERQQEKDKVKWNVQLLSDGRTDTTNSLSPSPIGSPHSSAEYTESSSSDSVDELMFSGDENNDCSNQLIALRNNGLSLSMASLYSDADLQRGTTAVQQPQAMPTQNFPLPLREKNDSFTDSSMSTMSAESVALSLLKKFSEKQLPKASDLKWLVSEQEAPQRLLPLPATWPITSDTDEARLGQANTRWRGTLEWAPPRAQIIFSIHQTQPRKTVIAKQNFRCAGCGMKIELDYMKRYRYCEYLGKYFCQCCHSNHQTYIPGRILHKWDFSKYSVSNFTQDLLDKMFYDPLFNIADINPALYRKAKNLEQVREFRRQLFSLKDFVRTCRHTTSLQAEFAQQSAHLLGEVHTYSLHDLVQVKNGELVSKLRALVQEALIHMSQCSLCQMKGFICEFCNNDRAIFPFQLQNVLQCKKCWACFHRNCYSANNGCCPKCKRIEGRKQSTTQMEFDSSENEM